MTWNKASERIADISIIGPSFCWTSFFWLLPLPTAEWMKCFSFRRKYALVESASRAIIMAEWVSRGGFVYNGPGSVVFFSWTEGEWAVGGGEEKRFKGQKERGRWQVTHRTKRRHTDSHTEKGTEGRVRVEKQGDSCNRRRETAEWKLTPARPRKKPKPGSSTHTHTHTLAVLFNTFPIY